MPLCLAVKLGGNDVCEVVRQLAVRGIPFAFVSGFPVGHNMMSYRDRLSLRKPFTCTELIELPARLIGEPANADRQVARTS